MERGHNSDALAVSLKGSCIAFVVADGVGSLEASPVASEVAALAAAQWVERQTALDVAAVPSLVESVNSTVATALAQHGVGATTLACAIISADRSVLVTVGDSEAIAIGKTGPAVRLNDIDNVPGNQNMLLAWIDGVIPIEPHVIEIGALPYRLCLVTDGITKVLDYRRIADVVRRADISDAARDLIVEARTAGAADDVTAVVLSGRRR